MYWAGGPGYVVGLGWVGVGLGLGRWTWLRRWAGGPPHTEPHPHSRVTRGVPQGPNPRLTPGSKTSTHRACAPPVPPPVFDPRKPRRPLLTKMLDPHKRHAPIYRHIYIYIRGGGWLPTPVFCSSCFAQHSYLKNSPRSKFGCSARSAVMLPRSLNN